jgi:hypothetical protein
MNSLESYWVDTTSLISASGSKEWSSMYAFFSH